MRFSASLLALLIGTGLLVGGPVGGPDAGYKVIPAGTDSAPGELAEQAMFHGGRRACVIVAGGGEEVSMLEIVVLDAAKQVVARGKGDTLLAAVWYPSRDEAYTVVLRNAGSIERKCWVALK